MKPIKGLTKQYTYREVPEGFWTDAKNMVKTTPTTVRNEDGLLLQDTIVGGDPIGEIACLEETIIFSVEASTSSIGRFYNGTYTEILNADLGFDEDYPVSGQFTYNSKGETIIVFHAENIPPRILNIGKAGSSPDYSALDLEDILLFPIMQQPEIVTEVQSSGGALSAGQYFIAVQYQNDDGTRTNPSFLGSANNIGLVSTTDQDKIQGQSAGSISPQSIKITLTEVDQKYDKIKLLVVKRIDNQVSAAEITTLSISSPTITYNYTGNEEQPVIPLTDITVKNPAYDIVRSSTQHDNELYMFNTKGQKLIDYQPYANNIVVNYKTELVDVNDPDFKSKARRSLPHGEVIALYIQFQFTTGELSRAFHIPGRPAQLVGASTKNETDIIDSSWAFQGFSVANDDSIDPGNVKYFRTRGTANNVNAATNMGFWQNENEVYPADDSSKVKALNGTIIGDLAGQKVRHHKTPSHYEIYKTLYGPDGSLSHPGYGIDHLDLLSFDLTNISIPDGIVEKVKSVRILMAKRTVTGNLVVTTDLYQGGAKPDGAIPEYIWTSGGNWDTNPTNYVSSNRSMDFQSTTARLHSIDLLKQRPAVAPSYIELGYKLTKGNLNTLFDYNTKIGGQVGDVRYKVAYCIDYAKNADITRAEVLDTNKIASFDELKYLAHNSKYSDSLSNVQAEECVYIDGVGPSVPITPSTLNNSGDGPRSIGTVGQENTDQEETFLITLKNYLLDCYSPYYNQTIIPISASVTIDNPGVYRIVTNSGDVHVGAYSFITMAPSYAEEDDDTAVNGVKVVRRFAGEFISNPVFRYEDPQDPNTKFYPRSDPAFLIDKDRETPITIAYNTDYNFTNDYEGNIIFNPSEKFLTDFPYRVIRARKPSPEDDIEGAWKLFRPEDYYEATRQRGVGVNIQAYNDKIFLHHTDGLFVTKGSLTIKSDINEIVLGNNGIFEIKPDEIIPSALGFLGTHKQHACTVTKHGYLFESNKRIFLIGNSMEEISLEHFRDWMQNNIVEGDNPYTGNGMSFAYDETYDRIIMMQKSDTKPFTISYTPMYKQWISYHDYINGKIFTGHDNKLLSLSSNQIYLHNDKNSKCKFYDGAQYDWSIELVFTGPGEKQFKHLTWITEALEDNDPELIKQDVSFNIIQCITGYQDTGEVPLNLPLGYGTTGTVYKQKSEWNFNKLRDKYSDNNVPYHKKSPLMDTYMRVRLKYKNLIDLNSKQNFLYLYEIAPIYRNISR